jgi:O-antigen/teichoic acid export membrane protein
VAAWVVVASDRVLIGQFGTQSDVGLFGAASKAALGANLLITPFILAWTPFALRIQQQPNATATYARAFGVYVPVAVALTIASAIVGGPALGLLAGSQFLAGTPAVWPLVAGAFAYGAYAMLLIGLQIGHRTELISLTVLTAAATKLVASLVVIPRFGFIGAAATTLGAYILSAALVFMLGQRSLRIPYAWRRIVATTAVGILAAAAVTSVDVVVTRLVIAAAALSVVLVLARDDISSLVSEYRRRDLLHGPARRHDTARAPDSLG